MRWTITSLLFLSFGICRAQQFLPDTTAARMASDQVISGYRNFMGVQLRLFSGEEQIGYLPLIGYPYFEDEAVHYGTIVFEGIRYRDVPMLYDIIKDKLIITDSSGNLIGLPGEKVGSFDLLGHHFVQTPNGYYDVLVSGPVTIRAKREKRIDETIEMLHVVRTVFEQDHFVAVIDGTEHPFGSYNSLLKLLKPRKREIQRYLRSRKIKYRKARELAIVTAATWYNDHYAKAD